VNFTSEAQTFEVEDPPQANPNPRYFAETQSKIFPFELFKCLPMVVKAFIPATLQKIQDCTHLILVLGAISCIIMVVRDIAMLLNLGCTNVKCIQDLVALVFIVPCTGYNISIINQYDEGLQNKKRDAKEAKANLTRSYNDLLNDMDGLLTKSAESSTGLAERGFESKRRDFQRFLERVKTKFTSTYSGTKGDSDKLLMQFRRFVTNWLSVFEECSIDPVNCPKRVISEEELNRCTSIPEVADLCLERLRVTEVRFISIQRDQDAQMLRRNRNEIRRISRIPALANQPSGLSGSWVSSPPTPSNQSNQAQGSVTWVSFGSGYGFRCSANGEGEDPFPREFRFGCGRVVVLSSSHFTLICGFFVGLLLIAWDMWTMLFKKMQFGEFGTYLELVQLGVAQVCLVTMLLKFEELDVVQQLEREVKELAKQNEQVEKQRERMREFWGSAQQLTELWLHRTVPRLDLYKEIHSLLEDTEEDLLMKMSSANQQLEDLDGKLGALQAWRSDGALTIDDKKAFSKSINALTEEQEFDGLLVKLEEVTCNGMKNLENK